MKEERLSEKSTKKEPMPLLFTSKEGELNSTIFWKLFPCTSFKESPVDFPSSNFASLLFYLFLYV